jgi:hypothetical protein
MNLSESSFNFIDCRMTRQCIMNGCWAMNETNLWDWLRGYTVEANKGFMFSKAPELNIISNKMDDQNAPVKVSHSGASFGFTMRELDFIAKNGFEAYKQFYLQSLDEDEQTGGNQ